MCHCGVAYSLNGGLYPFAALLTTSGKAGQVIAGCQRCFSTGPLKNKKRTVTKAAARRSQRKTVVPSREHHRNRPNPCTERIQSVTSDPNSKAPRGRHNLNKSGCVCHKTSHLTHSHVFVYLRYVWKRRSVQGRLVGIFLFLITSLSCIETLPVGSSGVCSRADTSCHTRYSLSGPTFSACVRDC